MDREEILAKVKRQRESLATNPLRNYKYRIEMLKLLHKNIKEMEQEICDALYKDLNKSHAESYMTEVGLVLGEISYMIKHCKSFSSPEKVHSPLAHFHSKSYKLPSPYGSVLIISPWNYPFMLAVEPLVDAIAAGNSVVLRPSSVSHNVALVIEKLISKTFLPEQAFVVLGSREDCNLLLEQKFDYIFYTGSTNVGKLVMQKAIEHFTPYTLEMGGKSPCIVDETANVKLAAKRIVFGKFLNAGQTCVAPDYVYCAKSVKDELIKELERQIILQYSVTPLTNVNYPKIINEKRFNCLIEMLNQDKIVFGGKYNAESLKIEPTILDCDFDSATMQEEIFGPLLPIITFDTLQDAVNTINSKPKPLALYVFSSSKTNQDLVLNSCQFGGGCVNDTIMHIANSNLAFGGVGESGIGSYHGKAGFDTFTHYKSIIDKKTWIDMPMRYQPYNKFKNFLIRLFLR